MEKETKMNNRENANLQKAGNQAPIKCTILWLSFCLIGAILYFVLPIESGWTSEQIRESITNAYAPTSKDFWIFLILSVRFEVCFLLFLTLFSSKSNSFLLKFTIRYRVANRKKRRKTDIHPKR